MGTIKPIVSDVTIGNVSAFIDCVWLKCLRTFNFRLTMESIPIVCDWADGKVQTLRGNPTGEITIEAMNLNSTILKYALDAVVSTKSAAAEQQALCVHIEGIQWEADDDLTPTEWTAVIKLNSPNVDNVTFFTEDTCSDGWASATTPLNVVTVDECSGVVTLTTNDVDECADELWVSFDFSVDLSLSGDTELIEPPFSTFPDDHVVIAWHINKTTSQYEIFVFPRCQILPDINITFDNSNNVVTIPIRLEVVADTDFHPEAPLGWVEITDTLPAYLEALI